MDFKRFSILCVEDSKEVIEVYKELLSLIFKEVYVATDGKEGLEAFKKHSPDIILTDEIMPNMSGLEMVEEIRKLDRDIPIILVSAFDNKEMLAKAINLNITAFVKKPVTKDKLLNAFEKASKYALINRILFKSLRDKIKYKNYQEKLALEKEKKIIRIEKDIIDSFFIEEFYNPLDITSGDSFSIRRNCIFLVDAMGKGVSASITAMMATAFFNYLVDRGEYFENIVEEFSLFMKNNLLDYEILCFGIYKIENEILRFASFSMPSIFLQIDNKVEKIKSNNPPLSSSTRNIKFSEFCLKNVKKMLICTDGITESITKDNKIYLSYIEKDFLESDSLDEFEKKRKEKIIAQDDDATYFFLRRITDKTLC